MIATSLPLLLERMARRHILIVGDLCLDRYTWGDVERVSPEAPVLVLRVDEQENRLGGAASVAHLARGLGAEVTLASVVGPDPEGRLMTRLLLASGIHHSALRIDPARPTTLKERFVGRAGQRHAHQMLRVDRERHDDLDRDVEARLISAALAQMKVCEAVLVSDYGKGVCTPRLMKAVMQAAHERGLPVAVDPARSANYEIYRGATVITPNRLEASTAVGRTIKTVADALAAGRELCERFNLDHTLVTLDCDGMALSTRDRAAQGPRDSLPVGEPEESARLPVCGQHFPTRRREVYDVTGAGDMVLATVGLGLAAEESIEDAIRLANVAAGLEVERQGVVQVTPNEILADLVRHGDPHSDAGARPPATERNMVAPSRPAREQALT